MVQQETSDQQIRAMLGKVITEPSDSSWSSAVVMIPKKKNTRWRFVVYYRLLNKVTRKDCYPIPQVDEMLDLVSGSALFSSTYVTDTGRSPLTAES